MTRRLIVAAPGSGHGKTLVSAGFTRQLLGAGDTVALFKFGPDYLDPGFLESATGVEVRQLDYWLQSKAEIAAMLAHAEASHDWVIIEGMMGLFDGDWPVSQLAKDFDIPILLVVDASAMAQSFGAVVHGLATYDPDVAVIGVIANRAGSTGHGEMLAPAVRAPVKYMGWVTRDEALTVEHRHLGLSDLSPEAAAPVAELMARRLPDVGLLPLQESAPTRASIETDNAGRLGGLCIAVARDRAFSFVYHANIDFLRREGATVVFFSPLSDGEIPNCDALYLPGGYPECHLADLSENRAMIHAVREHVEGDKPCIAECGGMLYLQRELRWKGQHAPMVDVFAGCAEVMPSLAAIGYQSYPGSALRGHTFHHARIECLPVDEYAEYPDGRRGEAIYKTGNTRASFVHWMFSSEPALICSWIRGR